MRIVSWNVAGFRAVLKKGFEEFFNGNNADVFCLQEVKALPEQITFHPEGYQLYVNPAERKGYSGTAIYTRIEPVSVSYGIGIEEHDHEGRVITMEFADFYLVNVYVPNVKRELTRLDYRMQWEDDFRAYLKNLRERKPVVCCGDMNVAHQEIDIKNAKANIGNAGFTWEERGKMTEMLASGLVDAFRHKYPDRKDSYTWWSYLGNVRARNIGWRIDYFLVSEDFSERILDVIHHTEVMGSDHCPIEIIIA